MPWPMAWGEAPATGTLKQAPEDFVVEEQLSVALEGDGEHLWLWVEKCDRNTVDVARELATCAGVPMRAISWSGLKDRRALTRQWFSIHQPRQDEAMHWHGEGWQVLHADRHRRKLRIGTHHSNRFQLRVRALTGDQAAVEQRLVVLAERGVPNYFGEQRFGRAGRNIQAARDWFTSGCPTLPRQRRSLLLSTARSMLFNQVLAGRVADGSWCRGMAGEVWMLNGRGSIFQAALDAELEARIACGEVHPTGPLWGCGEGLLPTGDAAQCEQALLELEPELTAGLIAAGMRSARRSLRLMPRSLRWQWQDDGLVLDFDLPAGCFATVLVRELLRPSPAADT